MRRSLALLLCLALEQPHAVLAQNPFRHWAEAIELRYSAHQPVLAYTLRVDSTDLSGFSVEIAIRNAPDTVRLGMVVHPEYDDRYWRYVEGFDATGPRGATVSRLDSALWRVVAPGGECRVRYRIHLPAPRPGNRDAWVPFLASTGGLVGGPHAFMYLLGATLAPAHVRVELPEGWSVATGLAPTGDPRTWFASSAFVLVDSPLLVGRLRRWTYLQDGVPHQVVYWPGPSAAAFDTVALVSGLQRLTAQAAGLFGRLPYRDYTFQLQDLAGGALEHANSVSLGAPSSWLQQELTGFFAEAAHEYVHTWNLVRLRPAEYRDVDYRTPPRSRGLWWSEGVTMYYADLLLRRAGLPRFDSTRVDHLKSLITRYLSSPGYTRFSPESVSAVAYGFPPGVLGDYSPSVHLQGELLANLIDFEVRWHTSGSRSLADLMRLLLIRYSSERGFTSAGIEQAMAEVCHCPAAAHRLFDRHVRRAAPIDFGYYLGRAGLRAAVSSARAVDDSGRAMADLRVFATDGDSGPPRLLVTNPHSAWGRAGLHTGDRIVAVNGVTLDSAARFRTIRNRLRIGDTVRVTRARNGASESVAFVMSGFDRPVVRIEEDPMATGPARRVRADWLAAEY
jgi:predicted metalloprotease with PDZ domain